MSQNKYTTANNPTLAAVSNADGESPVYLYADPATHGLVVSATVTSSGGAILDGVDPSIKATVVDYANSNPLTVRLTDTNGDYVAAGAGTQYTDAGTPPLHPVGGTIEWDEGGTWRTVSTAKPLPVTATFSPSGTQDVNLTKVAGAAISQGHGTAAAAIRVELPTDGTGTVVNAAGSAIIGKVGIDQTTPGTTNAVAATNLPTTVDTNSGSKSASTLRVVLATDQPALTNKLLVTPDSVALPANQSVNVSQINGVTPLMGNGVTGTGSQRVTIASDNTAFSVNATLSAETTKVIGVTRTADGAGNLLTSNSTTYTAKFGLDGNLLGTLGTAFSTAGKVDVKGADGDVFVRQATGTNLHTVIDSGTITAVTAISNALPAGTNVIGHVITDTGSTTAVTGTVTISGAVTEATLDAALISQEANTSGVKGLTAFGAVTTNAPTYTTAKSDALSLDTSGLLRISLKDTPANTNKLLVTPDSVALPANQSVNVSQINAVTPLMGNGVTGTGSQRVTIASDNTAFSVNATLSAETTKVIGVTRTADGAGNLLTTNSTTYTAKFGLDGNLLGTLGTAFSTAGKVDVKAADGDVFVRQATAANLNATVVQGTGTNLHTVVDSGTITTVTTLTGTTTLTPGTGATNLGKAEDAAHTTGDVGVAILAVRDDTLNSTSGTEGDYEMFHTTADGALWVTQAPSTTNGWTAYHLASAGSTNATNIKASAGTVGGWFIYNSNAAARKVAFHNTAGSPTAGASVFFAIVIPPSSGANLEIGNGVSFSTGIAITTVTGLADNDGTAVAANDLIINIWYK